MPKAQGPQSWEDAKREFPQMAYLRWKPAYLLAQSGELGVDKTLAPAKLKPLIEKKCAELTEHRAGTLRATRWVLGALAGFADQKKGISFDTAPAAKPQPGPKPAAKKPAVKKATAKEDIPSLRGSPPDLPDAAPEQEEIAEVDERPKDAITKQDALEALQLVEDPNIDMAELDRRIKKGAGMKPIMYKGEELVILG